MAGIENVKAKDMMSRDLITAKRNETVSDAIGLMRKHDISEILIEHEKKGIVGMVTDDSFVKRRHLPLSTKLEHIMAKPADIKEEDSIVDVCEMLLSSGLRGIPVKNKKGDFVGFVARTDVMRAIPEIDELRSIYVKEVMTPNPTTINEQEGVGKAKNMMRSLDERVIPVVDDYGSLSGMIGLADIIKGTFKPMKREALGERSGEKESPMKDMEVRSIMIDNPITTTPHETVREAATKMRDNEISTLVVQDGGKIKGIVTQIDLVETVASFRESDHVYVQISGLEEEPETIDVMYDILQKYLSKFAKVVKPLVMNVHVVTHQKEGEETKYSIRLRLQTDHGMFYTKEFDWNIMKALDEALENMRRTLYKEKEKRVDHRKKHPKYRT
ncbi:MAG: CBS domain-containing protein [Thermoplasmata archaeon]